MREGRHLGEYLTARRRVTPPDPAVRRPGGRRRAVGLNREEVARLAGISHDYYVRIEQGRVPRPSARVLDALAGVLRLDAEATGHLHRLANPETSRPAPAEAPERRAARLVQNLRWSAVALNRRMDVLARNRMATVLHQGLEHEDNFLRMFFLSPFAREGLPDWEQETFAVVAHLRAVTGVPGPSPVAALVEELKSESRRFHELWTRYDVRMRKPGPLRLRYPGVGDLTLQRETLLVAGDPDVFVFTLSPEAGSPSEKALLSLAADRP